MYTARGIYGGNAAEPGDYELEGYDEHVDGCDCDACRVMLFELSDTQFLLLQHRQLQHAVLVDDCPACDAYGVEEARVPNLDWDDTDVPF